ncbi:hypothetical protein GGR56DRAFT_84764 [Xylariaceae sp. FL0804]|nr:hypothetical protein GGR56DRAFT_84764 [Xylariaceae sp. FL0804]
METRSLVHPLLKSPVPQDTRLLPNAHPPFFLMSPLSSHHPASGTRESNAGCGRRRPPLSPPKSTPPADRAGEAHTHTHTHIHTYRHERSVCNPQTQPNQPRAAPSLAAYARAKWRKRKGMYQCRRVGGARGRGRRRREEMGLVKERRLALRLALALAPAPHRVHSPPPPPKKNHPPMLCGTKATGADCWLSVLWLRGRRTFGGQRLVLDGVRWCAERPGRYLCR